MAGRDENPGDIQYNDLNDHVNFLSRPERCIISPAVNTRDGLLRVTGTRIISEKPVTCPVLWMSAQGRQSAWGRYMPMGNERVHILYRNDGTPIFHSYDATVTKDDSAGWTELSKAQREGNIAGWKTYRELKRGEFDFKSSGNAYIFGSNQGTLLLAGGQAYVKLDNIAYRCESKAAEFHQTSSASQTRFGIVFRKLTPADMAESQVPPGGTYSEFLVDLNDANPATGLPINPIQSKAKIHFGDILDNFGIPVIPLKVPGPFLRGLISLGDAASATEVFRLEIDQTGNVAWIQGPLGALGLDMTMMAWTATVTTQTSFTCPVISFTAVTSHSVTSPITSFTAATSFTVTSPIISLGGAPAIHPILLTNFYRAGETAANTAVQTAHTTAAIAYGAAQIALTTLQNVATGPLAPLKPGFIALQAALAPMIATEGAAAAAITTFEGAAASYLSLVSKTA